MSSILKALRKLEEEKARREDGRVDIARDILRGSRGRDLRPVGLLWFVAGVILLGAGLALGILLGPWQPDPNPSPALRMPNVAPTPAGVPDPLPAISPSLPPSSPAPSLGDRQVRPARAEFPPPEEPFPVSRLSVPQPVLEPTAAKDGSRAPAPVGLEPGRSRGLTLNGIAYQDEPTARLAIINDLPVMEGNLVEGAVVEKILPDRVIISRDGEEVELRIEGGEPR